MVGGCKRQMVALTEDGLMKLQQCGDQEEREKAGKKWQAFLKAVWETIHEQITERKKEMGTYIGQEVKSKSNGMCEMFRVGVWSQLVSFQERQKELEQRIRNVSNAADARLLENNNRNNHQEKLLKEICEALIGLKGIGENRNSTQKIYEKQTQMERKNRRRRKE